MLTSSQRVLHKLYILLMCKGFTVQMEHALWYINLMLYRLRCQDSMQWVHWVHAILAHLTWSRVCLGYHASLLLAIESAQISRYDATIDTE